MPKVEYNKIKAYVKIEAKLLSDFFVSSEKLVHQNQILGMRRKKTKRKREEFKIRKPRDAEGQNGRDKNKRQKSKRDEGEKASTSSLPDLERSLSGML